LQRRKKLSFEEAASIFVQLLDCLEYTHKSSVAHADLKLSNIVLTDARTVKVLGYGERKHFQAHAVSEKESANRVQANGIEASQDIYAVGAMLFETLTGKSLIDFENSLDAREKLIEEIRKFLYSVDPFVPEEIKSAVIKALFPNQTNRFQNAADFRDVLLAYGFDNTKIEEEISVSDKLMTDAPPAAGLQPFDLTGEHADSSENSIVSPFEAISGNKKVAVYSANFSPNQYKIREKKSDLTEIAATGRNVSAIKTSFLRNSQKSLSAVLGAAIFTILVSHFVWQFYFIRSENPQIVATTAKTQPVDRQVPETKPEPKAENREYVKPPPTVLPDKTPPFEAKPSQTVLKKKAPVETRAERLRRVEKALTGI
jgi:serine/threonine protein kinase